MIDPVSAETWEDLHELPADHLDDLAYITNVIRRHLDLPRINTAAASTRLAILDDVDNTDVDGVPRTVTDLEACKEGITVSLAASKARGLFLLRSSDEDQFFYKDRKRTFFISGRYAITIFLLTCFGGLMFANQAGLI